MDHNASAKPAAIAFAWVRPRIIPTLLLLAGVALAVYIAVKSSQPQPPTLAETGTLTIFSAALNIGGGATFARIGRAHPTHARSAVRRLLTIANILTENELTLTEQLKSGQPANIRNTAQRSLDLLQSVAPQLRDAIEDWNDVHPEALREVLAAAGTTQETIQNRRSA